MKSPIRYTDCHNEGDASHLRLGRVTSVNGSVVDIAFPLGALPPINTALEVQWDGPHRLIVEVQQHVDLCTIRGVAMHETAGLRCGVTVQDTGAPIRVPTGESVLKRAKLLIFARAGRGRERRKGAADCQS